MKILNQPTLDKLVERTVAKKNIFGAVFCIESNDKSTKLISASGNIKEDGLYYIASINKLFVSAIILKLRSDNKLKLEDKISKYLSNETMSGLHTYKSIDYSNDITIAHLLSQTSGLPCYLIDKMPNGKKVMTELINGIDQSWPIDRVIHEIKNLSPSFPPGKEGKARYVDTNHQILSKIIENLTGDTINIALKKLIFDDLGLTNTYVADEINKIVFAPVYYKSTSVKLPGFLSSTGNDIISDVKDQMIFLRAFFQGHFFSANLLKSLEKWNNIFFPFKYGLGIQMFYLPRILSPFKPVPPMLGHCGSVGSVAFFIPEKNIYITGTVNQQASPNVAFQLLIKIINLIK